MDLDALSSGAVWVGEQLGKQVPGLLSRAGAFPLASSEAQGSQAQL
jgi:hypothetical protein